MKTTSSGFENSKLHSYVTLLRYFGRDRELAKQEVAAYQVVKDLFEKISGTPVEQARMLEIGCGQRFADTLLFHTEGAHITGIDLDHIVYRFTPAEFLRVWRRNGFERFLKTLVRHICFDSTFYRTLATCSACDLRFDGLDIRHMSACDMAFADDTFDYVYSNAVFEHIDDVDKAWSEVNRVLKPAGCARIGIHLFPSLSGGHHMGWMKDDRSEKNVVPPWDHLRENRYPAHLYMNKLNKDQHLEAAKKHCDIIDVEYVRQGEDLLTDEILSEIKGYSSSDLTTHAMIVIARPR
jgi:SAM-dependent methyltransferase